MTAPSAVTFAQALRFWLKLGFISFGGPAGQIAIMHRELVEQRRWISERRFLHALNYCMLLPGPEAQQLATYIGWLMHRTWGGIVAGGLFVLPSLLLLIGLSWVYVAFGHVDWVAGLFYGIKPAVVALVLAAVVGLARRVLDGRAAWLIAAAAFLAIFFLDVPFPLIIGGAAVAGWLVGRRGGAATAARSARAGDRPAASRPPARRGLLALAVGAVAWLAPTLLVIALLGTDHVLSQLAIFFSIAALVTFGGAYAVLAFVAQQAVGTFGWLSAEQMLDGLGMAESTPGPLIMVVQFVGFMAAFAGAAALDPLAAGVLGALLVTWVTFVPSFSFIVAGAPYVEYLQGRPQLTAALSGITAAVVGVILNLALWFGLQTLFRVTGEERLGVLRLHTVDLGSLDLFALALAGLALVLLLRLRWPLLQTLALCAAIGFAYHLAVG